MIAALYFQSEVHIYGLKLERAGRAQILPMAAMERPHIYHGVVCENVVTTPLVRIIKIMVAVGLVSARDGTPLRISERIWVSDRPIKL